MEGGEPPGANVRQRVVVVMPAYNAERTLERTVAAIPPNATDDIILVDDASRDGTVGLARRLGLHVVIHDRNRGYGANQKTCYREALERRAEIIVMVHPDFQYDPARIPDMVRPIALGQAEAVIGSRFLGSDPATLGMPWWKVLGNRFLTTAQNTVLGTRLSECHSGYRAYRRRVLETIPFDRFANGFVFDSEMIAALAQHRFRIAEVSVPARYGPDFSSLGFVGSLRYGFQTLATLLPVLVSRLPGRSKKTTGSSVAPLE